MKKFLAVLFSVVILAAFLAVPAFAVVSPEGDIYEEPDVETDENDSEEAPQTGNEVIVFATVLTLGSFAGMVATKKAIKE